MVVRVGTSGWQYDSWRGVLYPAGLAQRRWLERYAEEFATVENNGAFYRLPRRETVESWRERLPDDVVMAMKASRYLTHIRRLRDPEEPVRRFLDVAAGLGGQLGPVLIQLPPNLKAAPDRLDRCLSLFPRDVRVAVEPRHESWWTDEVRAVLEHRGAALCWADRRGRPVAPLWRTTGWGYLRLHEGAAHPWPKYGGQALRSWADRLADTWADDEDVYVYFNNDPDGAAVRDAARFAGALERAGRRPTRTPSFASAGPS
ncbi:DUF72 domain-containing protein [Jiangella anatolica]|uniref:DUF72 domain-containing protein n=1 Tax=Jiangella anatolica TaxID=2670374 RepID=A0A2W2B9E4_9ACTN|nr:DUF72 domain-containing protein [Jiangella anatolica]PZF82702.1 DUF72 domain-containing protein [Jiangella anatolica]